MPLSEENLAALLRRRASVLLNADPGFISDLIDLCLKESPTNDMKHALGVLKDLSVISVTLGNDIDILLQERAELLDRLKVYEELERLRNG